MILNSKTNIKYVYQTGQIPVLVTCNDDNEYVCKHSRGGKPSYVLFVEWVVYKIMSELGLDLPFQSLVKIKDEHINTSLNCQPIFFKHTTCFATRFLEYAEEWNQLTTSKKDLKRIINKEDLLIIAFIDLWLSNEDRNWNNFNLLMHPSIEGLKVIPIDHGGCFNTLCFQEERPLYHIDFQESIINTEFFKIGIKGYFKNLKEVSDFIEKLYLRISKLEDSYDKIILGIPEDWQIPMNYIVALKQNIFKKEWLVETKTLFLSFIKISFKLK
jgi:hypothetical protein